MNEPNRAEQLPSTALSHAAHLLDLRRPAEAERIVRGCLAEDPESTTAYVLLTRALTRLERHAEAIEAARTGLSHDPDHVVLLVLLAQAHSHSFERRAALAAARRACLLAPSAAFTHYAHAIALSGGWRLHSRQALRAVNESLRLDPHSADSHNLSGILLQERGKFVLARGAYHEALRMDPHHTAALNNLATLDLAHGRMPDAAQGLTHALGLDPQDRFSQRNLHRLLGSIMLRCSLVPLLGGTIIAMAVSAGLPWLARVACGGLVLLAQVRMLRRSTRHLPPTLRRVDLNAWRSWPWWLRLRVVTLVSLTILMILTATAPQEIASFSGAVLVFGLLGRLASTFWDGVWSLLIGAVRR